MKTKNAASRPIPTAAQLKKQRVRRVSCIILRILLVGQDGTGRAVEGALMLLHKAAECFFVQDSVGHGWGRSFPGSIGRSVCLDGMGEKKVTEAQA